MGDSSGGFNRRELLRDGLIAGGAAVGMAAANADGATPPSVQLALAKHWPWGAEVNESRPFYLSPDTRGGTDERGGRRGIDAPLLVVPFVVLVDIGEPAAVTWPFHVHLEATGQGLAAKAVGQNIRFPTRPPHRVTTKEWLGIFPVKLERGELNLEATIHEHAGGPAGDHTLAHTSEVGHSSSTVAGEFGQAPSAATLPIAVQSSMLEHIARQSEIPFDVKNLLDLVTEASESTKAKLAVLKERRSSISIADMFEMQMLMNHLSQLSEMSTSVLTASHTAIQNMARSVK